MGLGLKMRKKKEKYKINNTFTGPRLKLISKNNRICNKDMSNGGQKIQYKLMVEEKQILQPELIVDQLDYSFQQKPFERFFPVDKIKDGSIIKLFNRTFEPAKLTDVVCPHFYELKWANGCNFNCAWCYLNGTYRFLNRGKKPYLKNINTTLAHLDYFFNVVKNRSFLLNSGELSDSLLFENDGAPLTKKIIPKFMKQKKHKLLILTKSNKVNNLLNLNAQNYVIASFSLNAFKVSEKWEKAPKVIDRIKAAKKLYDRGYTVRIRIDPMVPIKGWEKEYKNLVDNVFDNFVPERITLGSLRGLSSTINNCKDTTWTEYLTETSNWGKKIGAEYRFAMYSSVINQLSNKYDYHSIALCKETVDIWNKLGLDHRMIKCNCLL